MERLSPADAWYLYLETPTVHLHVTGVIVLDPASSDGRFSFDLVRRHIAERLHLLPEFRRRLLEVPLGIDHPVFVEDPEFDLDRHLRRVVLRSPATTEHLSTLVGSFASAPLDPSKPLWEMLVVEGLDGGRAALVTKLHHCIVDGMTGVDILSHLVDPSPEPGPDQQAAPPPWRGESIPTPCRLALGATAARLADPLRPVRAAARSGRAVLDMAATSVGRRIRRAGDDAPVARPFDAPRTMFNGALTHERTVAMGSLPLHDVKVLKSVFGVTVNDVVLACVTHGLRSYLDAHDALPDRALVCSVPVSVHHPGSDGGAANQVSNMFVQLPTHLADPTARLRHIHEGGMAAKELQRAVGDHMISDVVDLIPPSLFRAGTEFYTRSRLAEILPPVHNLIVSNVRGSPDPLYIAGAQLVGIHPFGPLMEGTALNVTVLSNLDSIDIGLVACPRQVRDLDELLDGIIGGLDTLCAAARS